MKKMNDSKKKFYSGVWHSIHVTAAWCNTPKKIAFFKDWIREMQSKLSCEECRDHMIKYIEENPPDNAANMFVWSWEFHNAVNARLGKPKLEYEPAMKLYIEGGVRLCNEGCGTGDTATPAMKFKPTKTRK